MRAEWLTFVCRRLAFVDEIAHVYPSILADDNIVSARAQGITRSNRDFSGTGMADHLKTADHPPTVEIPVVQPILPDNIMVEPVEVLLSQELTWEKPWAAEAFQSTAGAARTATVTG
jgi:hypothetical protein